MKAQQFLDHHGIAENPFSQEDAASDHVLRRRLSRGTTHPAWEKIVGSPGDPNTAVVFGEKGSGKTALRLQIIDRLHAHNVAHESDGPVEPPGAPTSRAGSADGGKVFVLEYDDFNPFLDAFRERLSGRSKKPERALGKWRLTDHMDAVLTLAVGKLVRAVLEAGGEREEDGPPVLLHDLDRLERRHVRDLLLLAAVYDTGLDQPKQVRWEKLRQKLHFPVYLNQWDLWLGAAVTLLVLIVAFANWTVREVAAGWYWVLIPVLLGWLPWLIRQTRLWWTARRVRSAVRVIDPPGGAVRRILARFSRRDLGGQPLPQGDREEDRYELLVKLQKVLARLGFGGMIVIVDRVDEPHLVNGSPERMRDFLWPLFDNKFLKHPGLGFKLLLPAEVRHFLNREEREFYERSRLDKQNMIPSLEWTGESLYDIADDRLRSCAKPGEEPNLVELFDDGIGREELMRVFARLRVPRHLFKYLYRLIVEHCNRFPNEQPKWTIGRETLESTLSLFMRDLDAFDRGMGTG